MIIINLYQIISGVWPRGASHKKKQMTDFRLCACLFILFFYPSSCHLHTSGKHIVVSATGERVKLKCVNWYGAHQELFVVGGLERTSVSKIVKHIVSIRSNCVRLPFSIDLWRLNPIPPPFAVGNETASECGQNVSAMVIFDCVVRQLTDSGIMVILNNHNSFSGWVGADIGGDGSRQGLWDLPGYSVFDWLACLESMAKRYNKNPLVVGMDIRNEIHDQDNTYITWGKSTDVTTDWRAASSVASKRIELVNPEMLIIVTGLCYAYDFKDMMDYPGPFNALDRNKLVYTSHVYVWAMWWMRIPWALVNLFSVVLLFSGFVISARQYRWVKYSSRPTVFDSFLYILMGFGPFATCWFFLYLVWQNVYESIGCSAYARHLRPHLLSFWAVVFLGVISLLRLRVFKDPDSTRMWLFVVGIICVCHAVFLITVSILSQSYYMTDRELSQWDLDKQPIPMWVSEFGTIWNEDRPTWKNILSFIKNRDLDFAYWALNGQIWDQAGRKWINEEFGLLNNNYTALRSPGFVSSIF